MVRDLPLDARKIDAPLLAFVRRAGVPRVFAEHFPRKGDFDRPALVGVGGIVERAVDLDGGFEAGNFPVVVRLAPVHVWLVEHQVPTGVQRVHLELVVRLRVALGIDEHLEIGVVENHGIVLVSVAQTCGSSSSAAM